MNIDYFVHVLVVILELFKLDNFRQLSKRTRMKHYSLFIYLFQLLNAENF
tara:strand:- start:6 stop:155 length:150 start_codon:yes stop_codon:yes gene_type:complete